MALTTVQVSASGLTENQLEAEQTWLKHFNQDGDSLNWSRWEKWWAKDAFLQFGNAPRIDGKEAIIKYLEPQINILELMHHEITRLCFDKSLGLIYQTVTITYKVKGDPQGRTIQVPGLGVLHKRVGEDLLMGFEVYIDKSPIEAVIKDVVEGNQPKE
ncbi:unnamed protein product [Rhizoctonia solani]|uniref:SnoaL-like domain-containing protein n=1 Tax=Rhizoctonia solani TaxID=456999 RepID=A0A8H3A2K2_9AGAM|nr:unnamed protein product [Rhizoctonia solani]